MIRKLLHFYWRFSRPMTLGVRGAVFDSQNRVFLVRHGYAPGWHFPGGGVETGETLVEALGRELLEEGNIRLRSTPQLHAIYYNSGASRRDHVAVFVVRDFDWPAPMTPTWEIPESGFFTLHELPAGTTDATRRRIEEILHGVPVSGRW